MTKVVNRRQEIIKAARHLFQTKEYEKTTMQDVMNALDIAKGTIYHYFRSKEALLEAVIENIVEESIEHMLQLLKSAQGTALEKMALLMKAGSIAAENKNVLDELHKPGNEAMHTRLLAVAILRQAPLYAQLIRQGCDEGVFQTKTALECAEFILSGAQFLTDSGIYSWSDEDLARRMSAFPSMIERLLSAPEGSFSFMCTGSSDRAL